MTPLLEVSGLRRHFGGVAAVDGVDLALHPGEKPVALAGDRIPFLVEAVVAPGIALGEGRMRSARHERNGVVLLIILSVALANFLIDIAYPLIDPRIRYEDSGGK